MISNTSKLSSELPFLLVSYDGDSRDWVRELLQSWSINVTDVWDMPMAVKKLLISGPFGAVVCDEHLPNGSAIDLVRLVRSHGINVPFVVIAKARPPLSTDRGMVRFMTKPLRPSGLWDTLDEMLDGDLTTLHRRLDAEDSASWNGQSRRDAAEQTLSRLEMASAVPA